MRSEIAKIIYGDDYAPGGHEPQVDAILSLLESKLPKEQDVPAFEVYKDGSNNLRSVAWHTGRNELLADVKKQLEIG